MPATKTLFIFSLLAFFISSIAQTQTVKVIDGDTIHLDGEKIRFSGIDAPELNQTCNLHGITNKCGEESKNLLSDKILKNEINCIREGKDQYNRVLAECFIEGYSLSQYLVEEGYAFAYRQYSKKFIIFEEDAQKKKKGMWAMEFIYPWEFRKTKSN